MHNPLEAFTLIIIRGISSDISRFAMPIQGFAIRRNGTCLSSETSCGTTWEDWQPCCPGDTECADDLNDNTQCNPPDTSGPAFSRCSNPELDLYQANGFFCCESGQTGFTSTESGWKGNYGCAEKDTFDNKVMRSLSPAQTGTRKYSTCVLRIIYHVVIFSMSSF